MLHHRQLPIGDPKVKQRVRNVLESEEQPKNECIAIVIWSRVVGGDPGPSSWYITYYYYYYLLLHNVFNFQFHANKYWSEFHQKLLDLFIHWQWSIFAWAAYLYLPGYPQRTLYCWLWPTRPNQVPPSAIQWSNQPTNQPAYQIPILFGRPN